MKTAIIGASGFIGSHLFKRYRTLYSDCLGTGFRHHRADLVPFDLRQPDIRPLRLMETGHEAVVIAAAEANIHACETDPNAAAINVRGTLDLIEQLGTLGMRVVFLSTDNVFDGKTGGYSEASPPNPPTAYGRQKWEVEREMGKLCPRSAIVRLSKTFGLEKGDGTLLDQMASSLVAGQTIAAAEDLIFSPTWVGDVVEAIMRIHDQGLEGTVHVAGPDAWSRYDLAVAVAEALGCSASLVERFRYADLGLDPNRPLNTSLRSDRFEAEIGMTYHTIESCIDRVAANWKAAS